MIKSPDKLPRKLQLPAKSTGSWFEFDPRDMVTLAKWLAKHITKRIKVSFEVYSNSISEKQRNYFFGVIIEMILEAQGELINEPNKLQLERELSAIFNMVPGMLDPQKPSFKTLSQLSTVEAEEFFKNIRQWCQDFFSSEEHPHGLFIPLPNEYDVGMVFSEAARKGSKKDVKAGPDPDAPGDSIE